MDFSEIPLKPMLQPEAIGWWPPAPGWWLLLVLVVVGALLLWRGLQRRRRDPRRHALQELEQIRQRFEAQGDARAALVDCNALLKRSALTLFRRQQVASLSGQRWLQFLLDNARGSDASQLQRVVDGPYRASVDADLDIAALFGSCRQWIKTAGKGKQKDV